MRQRDETVVQADYSETDPRADLPRGLVLFSVLESCLLSHPESLAPWKNAQWIEQGISLGMVCRRKVVLTDATWVGSSVRR